MKKKILSVLLWIWQLPQHIVALIILAMNKGDEKYTEVYDYKEPGDKKITVHYVTNGVFRCGVSLGNYILLHKMYDNRGDHTLMTARHEYGHSIQSKYLGIFYLIIVGLPSACNNIIDRIFNKGYNWYYMRYPEKWADDLGNVNRWN